MAEMGFVAGLTRRLVEQKIFGVVGSELRAMGTAVHLLAVAVVGHQLSAKPIVADLAAEGSKD